jgi:ferredoxin
MAAGAEAAPGLAVSDMAPRAPRRVVNPVLCDAAGYCAEMVPELITLDDWGYPIVPRELIRDEVVLRHAQRAVARCPRAALLLTTDPVRR